MFDILKNIDIIIGVNKIQINKKITKSKKIILVKYNPPLKYIPNIIQHERKNENKQNGIFFKNTGVHRNDLFVK